jgi:hypothetical protein
VGFSHPLVSEPATEELGCPGCLMSLLSIGTRGAPPAPRRGRGGPARHSAMAKRPWSSGQLLAIASGAPRRGRHVVVPGVGLGPLPLRDSTQLGTGSLD